MASRIKPKEWSIIKAIAIIIDVVQVAIDFIPPIGEIINAIADPIIGILLVIYFQIRGVSMIKKPSRILSLIGVTFLEEFTGGIAPAWILDVYYIQNSVINEEEEQNDSKPGVTPPRIQRTPLNKGGMRTPQRVPPIIK